jgi:hypothetical protein
MRPRLWSAGHDHDVVSETPIHQKPARCGLISAARCTQAGPTCLPISTHHERPKPLIGSCEPKHASNRRQPRLRTLVMLAGGLQPDARTQEIRLLLDGVGVKRPTPSTMTHVPRVAQRSAPTDWASRHPDLTRLRPLRNPRIAICQRGQSKITNGRFGVCAIWEHPLSDAPRPRRRKVCYQFLTHAHL